jgi:predicted nucleic acid-binding protein
VLRHANPHEKKWLEAQFATFPLLATPPRLWRDATLLGQKYRAKGINTGSLDLLISATAIHHDAEIITFDGDFSSIASISSLRIRLLTRPRA